MTNINKVYAESNRFQRLFNSNINSKLLGSMLLSEINETIEAFIAEDTTEIRDGLCDIAVLSLAACIVINTPTSTLNYSGSTSVNYKRLMTNVLGQASYIVGELLVVEDTPTRLDIVDIDDVLDAIQTYYLSKLPNHSFIADLHEIVTSNMSKFCKTNEVNSTISKYEALGVKVDTRCIDENLYACFAATNTKVAPKGKLLKCINYKRPNL
jgi:hypothetical protein